WIGVSDLALEGTWEEFPSMSPVNYKNWGRNEPNGDDRHNCASIRKDVVYGNQYRWDDATCTALFPFICERRA
ncbi:hypothetical protein FSP39_015836, partial [Pinctada imbricata]